MYSPKVHAVHHCSDKRLHLAHCSPQTQVCSQEALEMDLFHTFQLSLVQLEPVQAMHHLELHQTPPAACPGCTHRSQKGVVQDICMVLGVFDYNSILHQYLRT